MKEVRQDNRKKRYKEKAQQLYIFRKKNIYTHKSFMKQIKIKLWKLY